MGGKTSRTKGHTFERLVAIKFQKAGYKTAKRKLEYQISSDLGIDLDGTGIYDVQCKKLKKYAPITCIDEVPKKPGRVPVLITQGDYLEPMAVLPLEHFLKLIEVKSEIA